MRRTLSTRTIRGSGPGSPSRAPADTNLHRLPQALAMLGLPTARSSTMGTMSFPMPHRHMRTPQDPKVQRQAVQRDFLRLLPSPPAHRAWTTGSFPKRPLPHSCEIIQKAKERANRHRLEGISPKTVGQLDRSLSLVFTHRCLPRLSPTQGFGETTSCEWQRPATA